MLARLAALEWPVLPAPSVVRLVPLVGLRQISDRDWQKMAERFNGDSHA